jgi:hypothetical protein
VDEGNFEARFKDSMRRLEIVRALQGFRDSLRVFPGTETGILYVNLIVCPDAGAEDDLSPPAIGAFYDQRKEFLG